jgi:hypothetical protein
MEGANMPKTQWRKTFLLWLFSLRYLPLVFWLKPRILELTDTQDIVLMRFKRRTKNHVNSMYFGALCVGAELAPGILALSLLSKKKEKFSFVFKDFNAVFLKRCEGDVHFICQEGKVIAQTIEQAATSRQRANVALNVVAMAPSKFGNEPVAQFKLTLSVKLKN